MVAVGLVVVVFVDEVGVEEEVEVEPVELEVGVLLVELEAGV